MLRYLGILGVVGLLLIVAGLGVIAYINPLIAAGVAAILVGLGLIVGNVFRRALAQFGLGGMI